MTQAANRRFVTEAAQSTALGSKVNTSTYTAGLAGKQDAGDYATNTALTAGLATKPGPLTPTATKTAAYTAAVGELAMMNVTGGATVLTLPTAPADKATLGFMAIGATTVTPLVVKRGGSDTIGTSGATSVTVPIAGDVTVYQYQASSTRWLPAVNVKPLSQLDGRYNARSQMPIASAAVFGGGLQAQQNGPVYTRKFHTMLADGSDIRFRYTQPLLRDNDGTLQPLNIHAALEYPLMRRVTDGVATNNSTTITSATAAFSAADVGRDILGANFAAGTTIASVTNSTTAVLSAAAAGSGSALTWDLGGTIYPMTFAGKAIGVLENGAIGLISDPAPVEIPAGAQFASRQYAASQFGVYTTLTASTAANATSMQLNTLPGAATNPNGLTGDIVVDTGTNAEKVTILSYSGSAGAWIATLSPATPLKKAHANGAIVGGQVFYNCYPVLDQGEHTVIGAATDYTVSGVPTTGPGATSTTLTAASNIGDTKVTTVAAPIGTSITIDTAGNVENATVVNVVGEANPYTVYLAAPLAIAHASGVAVASAKFGGGLCPAVITAEKVSAAPPPPMVIIRGDSIADGVGYNVRTEQSFATDMFASTRPFLKTAKGGEQASTFAIQGIARRRKSLDHLGQWLFFQYATNDLYGGRSVAQMQADAATIIGWARQRGMKICVATCLPRTTSTDGWLTVANQTVLAQEANRLTYNTWVRGGAGGLADAVFDGCQALDSGLVAGGAETGKWRAADPTAGPYTALGLHPSYIGHQALAAYGIANVVPLLV